jgi:arsenate reductase (thioredoxin)
VRLSPIRIVAISAFVLTLGCSLSKGPVQTHDSQVLFVCEHGNVKSLMAASYFNQLARERRLPFQAVSRGSPPIRRRCRRQLFKACASMAST